MSFQTLYQRMFEARQAKDDALADRLLIQIEEFRKAKYSTPSAHIIESILSSLPAFAKATLNKNQIELGSAERANCINTAFNFHDQIRRDATYSTMEFLERAQKEFHQMPSNSEFRFGDLVVIWSRIGGSWDSKAIDLHKMNPSDTDFPYGLVFDHVMVRISGDLVFHKPDPTLESRYQIDYFDSVVMPNMENRGFELTFHRRNSGIGN